VMADTERETTLDTAIGAAKLVIESILDRKRAMEDRSHIDNATWQHASGMFYGAREVLRALEALRGAKP